MVKIKTKFVFIFFLALFGVAISSFAMAAETQFYIYDSPNRSVTSVVDASQNVINTYTYKDFGSISQATEGKDNVYKYNGEQDEIETGLIFLRNRYYDPILARFISKDSMLGVKKNPQSLNSYVYCSNNPINFIDPSGNTILVAIGVALVSAAWWAVANPDAIIQLWDMGTEFVDQWRYGYGVGGTARGWLSSNLSSERASYERRK